MKVLIITGELAYPLIKDVVSNSKEDIIVQWDHVESNMASARLAKKCGFVLFKKRPYYWFKIR